MQSKIKNTLELREFLLDVIDGIRNKTQSLEEVEKINATARNAISTAKLDLEYRIARGDKPEIAFIFGK